MVSIETSQSPVIVSNPQNKYPIEIVNYLKSSFRYSKTIENVLELFDYMLAKVYVNNDRWVAIPIQTIRSILGKSSGDKIMMALNIYITKNPSYSTSNHKCKEYCFTDKFISSFADCSSWQDFLSFIKSIEVGQSLDGINELGQSLSGSIEVGQSPDINKVGETNKENELTNLNKSQIIIPPSPIMLPQLEQPIINEVKHTYTLDYEAFTLLEDTLFAPNRYDNELMRIAAIQCAKTNLNNILTDNIKRSVSNKNGRHYDSITQLQKEIRLCLLKNTLKYLGQLDLKCCHGLIVLFLMINKLSKEEFDKVFNLFASPNLWSYFMRYMDVDSKDIVKERFNLFLNGSFNQNKGNPLYTYFSIHHKEFTDTLFLWKKDKTLNLSNEVNKIEASIIHSEAVEKYILASGIKCDIIHDCLWLYGDIEENVILDVAHFILRQFLDIHNIKMVFTLDIQHKDKQYIKLEEEQPLNTKVEINMSENKPMLKEEIKPILGQIHTTLKRRCLPLTERDDW